MNTGQRICVINLIFLVVTTLGVSGEWSKLIYDFMAVFNGDYDNKAQIKAQPEHDFIQCRLVPVNIPALPGRPILYAEWICNGLIFLMNLMEITESNGILRVNLINFTDMDQYKPLTFNVSDLSTLKSEDLRSTPGCKTAYERDGVASFVGSYGECKHMFGGKYGAYADFLTCNRILTRVPVTASLTSTLLPYDIERTGNKYPLIGAPDGYVNPCK